MHENDYCICIMTHGKRLAQVTSFVKSLREQTTADIYLGINGPYKGKDSEEYRKGILNLCLTYPNVYCSFFLKFRSFTHITNTMIINSGHEHCIINNDDLRIEPGFIDEVVDEYFNKSNRKFMEILGFASFFTSKTFMDDHGWFNECYLGLGHEDSEFARRVGYYSHAKIFKSTKIFFSDSEESNVDLFEQGANTIGKPGDGTNLHKYHKFNHGLFYSNQMTDRQINFRPFEKFFMDNYDKFW